MKQIKFLVTLLLLYSTTFAQVKGTIDVNVPNAVSKQELKDSIKKLNDRINAIKIGTGIKGDKGDPGKDGVSIKGDKGDKGDPGINTGGTGGGSITSIRNVKDWGVKGDGSTDDAANINRAIQDCYAQNIYTLYFPQGRYIVSKSVIMRNRNSAFSTLRLLGETRMWTSAQGSVLVPTFNDAPVIAIQLNKGSEINGFRIEGKFIPPGVNTDFWNKPFEQWGSGARDSRYSPECAIAVDFATNFGGVPADGGYPTLTAEYGLQPDRGSGGSTGVQIRNCVLSNHVVGIASSVNGQTQNEEELVIDFVDFTDCKTAVAGGQSQEKNNILSNFATWGGTNTVISQGVYGSPGHAGNWKVEKGNLAGAVVRIVNAWAAAWFPLFMEDVFAESLGEFGTYGTQMNAKITDCHFDFQEPQYGIGFRPIVKAWGMVTFDNCVFRYYNGAVPGYPMVISGGVYRNCTFGGTPVDVSSNDIGSAYGRQSEFYNCQEDGYGVGPWKLGETRKNIFANNDLNINTFSRYGDFSLQDINEGEIISFSDNTPFHTLFSVDPSRKSVTVAGDLTFTFTSDNVAGYYVNQLIVIGQRFEGAGVVTKIEGNTVTVAAATPGLKGDYFLFPIYPNHASIMFTGDVSAPNEISNIKTTWGVSTGGVGGIFKTPAGVFRIISYDAVNNKFKTMGNLPVNVKGYIFK